MGVAAAVLSCPALAPSLSCFLACSHLRLRSSVGFLHFVTGLSFLEFPLLWQGAGATWLPGVPAPSHVSGLNFSQMMINSVAPFPLQRHQAIGAPTLLDFVKFWLKELPSARDVVPDLAGLQFPFSPLLSPDTRHEQVRQCPLPRQAGQG
jgi:hypothetical protein